MAADRGISDDELRRQLQAYGEDVPPVTAQTRTYLLRKLKKFTEGSRTTKQTKKSPQKSTKKSESFDSKRRSSSSRRLIGFSSDEEETEGETMSVKKSKRSPDRGRKNEPNTSSYSSADSNNTVELSRRPLNRLTADSFNDNSLSNSVGNISQEKRSRFSTGPNTYRRRTKNDVDETDSGTLEGKFTPLGSEVECAQRNRHSGAMTRPSLLEAKGRYSDIANMVSAVVALVCIIVLFAYALQSPSIEKFGVTSRGMLSIEDSN